MNKIHSIIILSFTVLIFVSCSNRRNASNSIITEKKKLSELMDSLEVQSNKSVDFFYSKIATKYKSAEQNLSFKTSIKLKPDSLLNAMLTFANIPIVIANVTEDSVKLVNKRDKCFFYTDIDFLSTLLGSKVGLNEVEDIVLGRPVGFDKDEKYYQFTDSSHYIVATHKEKEFLNPESKDVMIKYFLSADSLILNKTFLTSPKDTTEVTIETVDFEYINGQRFPAEVRVEAFSPKGKTNINLRYTKTAIDKRKSFYFKVPDNYVECE